MTDSHHLLESWLIEGAVGDPPRELAVHAAVCDSCARRLGAFDSLAAVDVSAAGSPPPPAPPSRLATALAWARRGTAVLGTVVAGVIVVFAASQLALLVGDLPAPSDGVAFETGSGEPTPGEPRSVGPEPAGQPTVPESTPVPEATFIPLPTPEPGAAVVPAPAAPNLFVRSVSTSSATIAWTQPGGGGPPFKYELWRANGSAGPWFKIAELPGFRRDVTNTGLQPGQLYRFRIRAVSASGLGTYSNTVTATTSLAPTPPPSTGPTPSPSPSPSTPQCSDTIDNDGDGWVDFTADPGCSSAADDDESPANTHECNNGLDDDLDGYVDVDSDPSCSTAFDDSEAPVDLHACNNGLDDDGDGYVDVEADPGCSSGFDDSELPVDIYQCNNGISDDGDPYTDYPADPGCSSPFDDDESPVDP